MVTRKTRLMSLLLATLMVVSMLTAYVLPAVAETTYPSVTTVTAENPATVKDYAVGSVAEWMYLFNNHATLLANRDITIHLTADIDLSDAAASTFTGFKDAMFSFDGHGKTIKNWKPSAKVTGLFYTFEPNKGMNSLKNFTLTGCDVTAETTTNPTTGADAGQLYSGNGGGLVLGLPSKNAGLVGLPSEMTLENINVLNCKYTTTGEAHGILVGRFANNSETAVTLNIKNCALIGNTMTANAAHHGFVIGKINKKNGDVTVNISDIYLSGNTLTNSGSAGGLLFGKFEDGAGTLMINNIGIFDNNIAVSGGEANIIGSYVTANITTGSTTKNVLMRGNSTAGSKSAFMMGANPQNATGWTFSDCLIGTDEKMGGKGAAEVAIDPAQFATGEAAHRINQNLTDPSFYWAMENGKIVPATAATQTRKVTVKREGLADVVRYANGGSDLYLPYEGATVTGEGATLENQVLTVGTADVTVNVPASALVDPDDYTTFPAPAGVVTYPDAPGYLVSTLADLEDVQKNIASFTTAQTIHLNADITVTEGSVANNMTGLKASIDGHGKAIKNVKFTGTGKNSGGVGDAWLSNYTGASIQNLTLEGWNATNLGWGGGMLIAYSTTTLTIKNVTVKNCYAASANYGYHSFLVGNKGSGNLTMENIRVEDSEFVLATGLDNAGMILGRFNSNGALKIENVYAIGNTITGPSHSVAAAVGGVTGEIQNLGTSVALISNVALLNTTYKNDPVLTGLVIGRVKQGSLTLSNVIAATDGYENIPLVFLKEEGATVPGTVTLTNVYTDATYMQSGYGIDTPAAGNATAEQVTGGWAAYQLNAANVEQKWMMEGGYPAFSKSGVTMKQFTIIKEQRDGSYATEYAYYNPGAAVELTLDAYNLLTEGTTVTNYTYENKKLSFTMPETDVAAKFELTGADFTVIEEIKDKYAPYAGKFYPFTQGDAMKAAYDKAVEVLGKVGTFANKNEEFAAWDEVVALDAAVTEIKLVDTFTSVDNYNAPLGRDYDLFKSFDPTNWIVAEDDDWAKLTQVNSNFSGKKIHLVDDINMNNAPVAPLGGYNKVYPFAGTLDGHGKVFQKLAINYTPETGKDIYVGLVGALSGGTIQNLGIESGLIKVSGDSTGKEAMVSGIVGGVTGANSKIIHCWNGAEVNSVDYAGSDSTSGIARVEGDDRCAIDGCFNVGKINGGGWSGGISGAAHRNNIYNSFTTGELINGGAGLARWTANHYKTRSFNNWMATDNENHYLCLTSASCDCRSETNTYRLNADAYTTGELAWTLNANVVTSSNGIKTYYTMKNGKTVFGTEATQTRKVTFKCADVDDLVVYYNGGDEINLSYADNVEKYEITAGTATLDGNKLTMGITDLTIQVTLDGLNYTLLKAAMAKYDGKNTDYFVNAEGTSLTDLFTQANAYIANTVEGATQADVNALTDKINAEMSYTAYPNLPKAAEYELYSDAVNFLIADIADMNYVAGNKDKFGKDKVLHFAENVEITVPDGAAANSWNGVNAAIDGHGATIIGVDYEGTATANAVDGWLGVYSGAYLKNLTFKNWTATNLGWQGALLIASVNGNVEFANLHFDGCTVVKGEKNGLAILVGIQQSNVNTTYSNITFEGCTLDYAGVITGNCSFLIGKVGAGTAVADDIYLNGNKVKGTNENLGSGRGLVVGEVVTGTATFTDMGVFNTTYEGKAGSDAIIGGMVKKAATLNVSRVLAANNGEVTTLILHEDRDTNKAPATAINVSNVYTDTEYVVNGNMAEQVQQVIENEYTTEDIMGGKAVYALNQVEGAKTWAIKNGVPVMATAGLPLAITYTIAEVEYDTAMGGGEDIVLYTDADGKLIGMTPEIKADLEAAAVWGTDVQWEGAFTEEATFTGTPYPAHTAEHETSMTPNADGVTHTITCTHKEGVAECKYVETANCVFDEIVCVDENAKPDAAQHQAECDCGNKEDAVNCNTGDETEWIRTEEPATTEQEGFIKHECTVCGYSHNLPLEKLLAITVDADDGYAGEQMEVAIGLQSNPGVAGEVITVTYDPSVMSWDSVSLDAIFDASATPSITVKKDPAGKEIGEAKIALLHGGTYTGEALVTLVFNVAEEVVEGAYDFTVSISASDFEGAMVAIEDYETKVQIYDFVRGDVNDDRKVSIADAVLLLRMVNQDPNLTVEVNEKAADVDNNTEVGIPDVIKLLQFLNGSIDTLEPTA